jgi:hypothetical protein
MIIFVQFVSVALALGASRASAQINNFYISVDSRGEIHFGDYLGLDNPNEGRLTFLYAHRFEDAPETNHFHGIGVHFYEGDPASPTVTPTNGNNRIPENFTGQAPLTLSPGTGSFAGRLVSGENGEHYSDLTLYSVHDLAGFLADAPETYLFNSSAMGYQAPLAGLDLAISIVSMTPGLFLGPDGLHEPGDMLPIGGETDLSYEPVFWTEAGAAAGVYSAELQLVDVSGTFASSGTFHLDFSVVPEPSGGVLLVLAGLGGAYALQRRKP